MYGLVGALNIIFQVRKNCS